MGIPRVEMHPSVLLIGLRRISLTPQTSVNGNDEKCELLRPTHIIRFLVAEAEFQSTL